MGPKKSARLSGMFANFAQIILGALFVSAFFKGNPGWVLLTALGAFLASFILAILFEPETGGK